MQCGAISLAIREVCASRDARPVSTACDPFADAQKETPTLASMTYIARLNISKAATLRLIDSMPKERGSDFLAGAIAGVAVNRTYTRVDGDQFQMSRTAGMGPSVVCSGTVSEQYGQSVITLRTTYGLVPVHVWLALSLMALLAGVLAFAFLGRELAVLAWTSIGFSVVLGGYWWFKLWDAQFLRSELSKYLEGVRWSQSR